MAQGNVNGYTKILAWGDYCVHTGFANVMSNILRRVVSHAEIDVIGVNYDGRPDYDHNRFPGRVWPARSFNRAYFQDIYGMHKVIERLDNNVYDRIFILGDPFVVDKAMGEIKARRNGAKIVYYYPLDVEPYQSWIRESAALADFPVAYTQFAYNVSIEACSNLKNRLKVIPHGVDSHDFHPLLNNEYVRQVREKITRGRDTFLLVNVNRNTPRKDIPRSFMVLKELKDRGENVMLYVHCSPQDIGGDFTALASRMGLQEHVDYTYPHGLDPVEGLPVATVNLIYNAADAVMTTSLGEGWGFSITEAMATCTPVIAPAHSSIEELIADERGVAVPAGDSLSLWRMIDNDNMVLRPMTNVDHMASLIQEFMQQPDRRKRMAANAYQWVRQFDWDLIVKKEWMPLLLKDNYGNHTFN